MADTKVSALSAATAAAAANEIPINEAGTSKKLTVSLLRDFLGDVKMALASLHTISSTTQTEVTGLSVTLVAGTYRFSYFLLCQTATAGTGISFAINYTGTATNLVYMLRWPDSGTSAAGGIVDDSSNTTSGQIVAHNVSRAENTTAATVSTGTGGFTVPDVDCFLVIEGLIIVTDGGDLELWHGSETTTATRVQAGSNLLVTRVA